MQLPALKRIYAKLGHYALTAQQSYNCRHNERHFQLEEIQVSLDVAVIWGPLGVLVGARQTWFCRVEQAH